MLLFVPGLGEGSLLAFSKERHVATIVKDDGPFWRWFMVPMFGAGIWGHHVHRIEDVKAEVERIWSNWLTERGLEPGSGLEQIGRLSAELINERTHEVRLGAHRLGTVTFHPRRGASLGRDSDRYTAISFGDRDRYVLDLRLYDPRSAADLLRLDSIDEALQAAERIWNNWLADTDIRYMRR